MTRPKPVLNTSFAWKAQPAPLLLGRRLCAVSGHIARRSVGWGLAAIGPDHLKGFGRPIHLGTAAYGSTKVAVLAPSPDTVTGCVIVAFAAPVTASPKVTTAPGVQPPGPMLTS
jgi:hypothetical protein